MSKEMNITLSKDTVKDAQEALFLWLFNYANVDLKDLQNIKEKKFKKLKINISLD